MESNGYNLQDFFKFFKDNAGRMVRRIEKFGVFCDHGPEPLRFEESHATGHFFASVFFNVEGALAGNSHVYSPRAFGHRVTQKIRTTPEGWETLYEDTPGVWRVYGRYVFAS